MTVRNYTHLIYWGFFSWHKIKPGVVVGLGFFFSPPEKACQKFGIREKMCDGGEENDHFGK